MTLRIAFIGCGYIASASHGPACVHYAASHTGVELAACCDADAARARALGQGFGFARSYTDYAEMLRTEDPSAVFLCVPEGVAADIGADLLGKGVPVLLEKPPAMTVADMDRLIAIAAAKGTIHQVAFNRRFAPLVVRLRGLLQGQAVQHVDHSFTRVGRTRGDLATTAIHALDTLRFLLRSDYRSARLSYHEHSDLGEGVADYVVDCTFTNGATGHLTISPVAGANVERVAVYSAGNTYQVSLNWGDDAPGRQLWHLGRLVLDLDAAQASGSAEDYVVSGFYAQDEAFFDAVQAGRQPTDDLASARQSVEMMQCLRERRKEYIRG